MIRDLEAGVLCSKPVFSVTIPRTLSLYVLNRLIKQSFLKQE